MIMEQVLVEGSTWFAIGYFPGFWGSTGNSSIVIMVGDTSSCIPQKTYSISIDTFVILNIGVPSLLDSGILLVPFTIVYRNASRDWLFHPAYIVVDLDNMKVLNSRYLPVTNTPNTVSAATSSPLPQNKAVLLISYPPSVLIIDAQGNIENAYQLKPLATDTLNPDQLIPFTAFMELYTFEYPTFPDVIDVRTKNNDIFINLP